MKTPKSLCLLALMASLAFADAALSYAERRIANKQMTVGTLGCWCPDGNLNLRRVAGRSSGRTPFMSGYLVYAHRATNSSRLQHFAR
jgi:hypothetical protein